MEINTAAVPHDVANFLTDINYREIFDATNIHADVKYGFGILLHVLQEFAEGHQFERGVLTR